MKGIDRMKLEGKKINFFGDSITEGVGASAKENIYLNVLAKNTKLGIARNYGISGTRIARQTTFRTEDPTQSDRFDLDFVYRISEMDPDADVVVVFGGTNDFGHGDAPLGCFTDRTPYTFYGACHLLMQGLIERYPEAAIVFMTPMHRSGEVKSDAPDSGSGSLLRAAGAGFVSYQRASTRGTSHSEKIPAGRSPPQRRRKRQNCGAPASIPGIVIISQVHPKSHAHCGKTQYAWLFIVL